MLLHFAKQYTKIQTLCFAKYFGQPLKICGATHIFLTLLFKSPSQSFDTRKKNTKQGVLISWRREGVIPLDKGKANAVCEGKFPC